MMRQREEVIRTWFDMWQGDDMSPLGAVFAESIEYTEFDGSVHRGLEAVRDWFIRWHRGNKITLWEATEFLHQNDKTVAFWRFEGEGEAGAERKFDGACVAEWDKDGRICNLREYMSEPKG